MIVDSPKCSRFSIFVPYFKKLLLLQRFAAKQSFSHLPVVSATKTKKYPFCGFRFQPFAKSTSNPQKVQFGLSMSSGERMRTTRGFRGVVGRTLLLRAPPPADPKGPLLYYLELSIFGWLTPKFFSKRFRRQNILILMEERAPKKCDFLNKKISWLFGLGFKKNWLQQKIWSNWGLQTDLRELRKSIWST